MVINMKKINAIRDRNVILHDTELLRRRRENRKYLMELDSDKLLIHHRFEAGLDTQYLELGELHDGWENPLCQLRGHFLGHWLSAAAMEVYVTGDRELQAKADAIVGELAKCQQANGGEWCASVPEKYLTRIAVGEIVWAPQYTIHKTFMGLLDLYEYTGNKQALDIAIGFSNWFHRWSGQFDEKAFNRIMDVETGGMLEVWSQLYGFTKDPMHRELMERYYRLSLFEGLLEGKDVLTNMHANTTIPEALGAARAYEVTGEQKWLEIVQAYWNRAVTTRGTFCTGGQTNGEVWTPEKRFAARLGEKNQEHCTVYNMMRLADFLFRQTGDVQYADYWERNLFNGVMAQTYYQYSGGDYGECSSHPKKGLLTYFLPLKSGGIKAWSSRTRHFFCCHGSMVQANAGHVGGIYYQDEDSVYVCQYFSSELNCKVGETMVHIIQRTDNLAGNTSMIDSMTGCQRINSQAAQYPIHPHVLCNHLAVSCEQETEMTIRIRIPDWHSGEVCLSINGEKAETETQNGYIVLSRKWKEDDVEFIFHKEIRCVPLSDLPDTCAFMYGPVVLAGLSTGQALYMPRGKQPEELLTADNEREWASWRDTFRTRYQEQDISFIPLYQVGYEPYSVYFPIREQQ